MAGGGRGVLARAALAGACVVLAAGAAGCGGGGGGLRPLSKAAYDRHMEALGREISKELEPLSKARTAPEAAAAAAALQDGLRHVKTRLAAITPPAQVKEEHARLAVAVGAFADELDPVITRLRHGDLSALTSVDSLPALAAVQSDSAAIERKGYPIGG